MRSTFTESPFPIDDLYKCVHCGLCLNVCPTYLQTGLETESPRGRIALMKAVQEGRVGLTNKIVPHMEMCLQCRACEAACPSGVPYGHLMEAVRVDMRSQHKDPILRRLLLSFFFHYLLPYQGRLYFFGRLLRFYRRSPVFWLLSRMPGVVGDLQKQIPVIAKRSFRAKGKSFDPVGTVRDQVGLLSGCIMPLVQTGTMEATVRVLTHNGCRVIIPSNQVCCGAMNLHGGDRLHAQDMARRNIDAFLDADISALVVSSAGCGSTMKEYGNLLASDPVYSEKAKYLSSIVVDVTEYLAHLPLKSPTKSLLMKVTYQDPCHLAHAQRIKSEPREILRSIPGLQLIEMDNPDRCCGAAGLYSLLQREMSKRLLSDRMESVKYTEAVIVVTANPGCMIQLEGGFKKDGKKIRVCHVVDLLDEAYEYIT